MSYTSWLRRQIERLESEIRAHSVFDDELPATPGELRALRAKVVLHTFLKQQLLRRQTVEGPMTVHVPADPGVDAEQYDTQEFVLVPKQR